jgi:hypothetical protein
MRIDHRQSGLAVSASLLVVALLAVPLRGDVNRGPLITFPSPTCEEVAAESPEGVDMNFIDHFDHYATGSQMHGQGGWKGWDNLPAAGALTSTTQDRTAPNSVDINGAADLVHEYTGINSGIWTYTAWQYIPSSVTGNPYFILLNTYADGGPNNWSTQIEFNTTSDTLFFAQCTTAVCEGPTLPIVYDQWVEIKVEIDFSANTQVVTYGGTQLVSCSWTEGCSGAGTLNLHAVDLFANSSSSAFYDDVSLSNLPFIDGFETQDTRRWHSSVPPGP